MDGPIERRGMAHTRVYIRRDEGIHVTVQKIFAG